MMKIVFKWIKILNSIYRRIKVYININIKNLRYKIINHPKNFYNICSI